MPHPARRAASGAGTLPAARPTALRAAAFTLALAAGGCDDPLGNRSGPGLVIDAVSPAAEQVTEAGFEVDFHLRDGVRMSVVSAVVEGPSGAVTVEPFSPEWVRTVRPRAFELAIPLGAPGAHVVTLIVTDTAGRTVTATLRKTLQLPEAPYTITALPDAGGSDADALAFSAGGAVGGWVRSAAGTTRPARWDDGRLTVLDVPLPDSISAQAVRINDAGDALVQFAGGGAVRRADGVFLRADTLWYSPYSGGDPRARRYPFCCLAATDLTENRQALFNTGWQISPLATLRLDVATGAMIDTLPQLLFWRNEHGQMAGVTLSAGYGYPSFYFTGVGLPTYGQIEGLRRSTCDWLGRSTRTAPISLADDGTALVDGCGNIALQPGDGRPGAYVHRKLGTVTTARLSRDGRLVAGLTPHGALHLWTVATGEVRRLALPAGWTVDRLHAVHGSGAVAAHGVQAGTGRPAALLLTPAR